MFFQFAIILIINFVGVLIQRTFNLPLPGTIIGMILLFLMLWSKILKIEQVEKVCDFLVLNMIVFFLAPAVELLEHINLLKDGFFRIILLLIITTVITMAVTGRTVQYFIKKMEKK